MTQREVDVITAEDVGTIDANALVDGNAASKELTPFKLPEVVNPYQEDFDKFATGSYLPRLQLEGSSSDLVKKNKVQKGSWCIIVGRDSYIDLGLRVDVLVLTYRTKALDITDKKHVVCVYDKNDPEFKRIKSAGDNANNRRGYLYGLDFLLFIPGMEPEHQFVSLFMGNPTARQAAKNFKPLMGKVATLTHEIIEANGYVWEGAVVNRCTTLLKELPPEAETARQMDLFLHPTTTGAEVFEEETVEGEEVTEERTR